MTISEAYEKMFKDGSANRPIKIAQPTPDNPQGGMGGIGNMSNKDVAKKINDGYDIFDSQMEQYVTKKKEKLKNKINENKKPSSSKIRKLERRIELLEGVVEKLMKAQMELLKNG